MNHYEQPSPTPSFDFDCEQANLMCLNWQHQSNDVATNNNKYLPLYKKNVISEALASTFYCISFSIVKQIYCFNPIAEL